jgi:cell division protein FtsW (lipid II flippase)
MKKRMTAQQEFEIMKLVLDKFLWLGFGVMIFGVYKMIEATVQEGLYFLIVGIALLIIFTVMIVKEYEVIK